MASRILPGGGTAMFAFLALAGDVGCSVGPGLAGFVADAAGGRIGTGILSAIIFPVFMLIVLITLRKRDV